MKEQLVKIVNQVSNELVETIGIKPCNCVEYAIRGAELLRRYGVDDVKLVTGEAAFSVNGSQWGIVTFGIDHVDIKDEGDFDGHMWIKCQGRIVDFSILALEASVKYSDSLSGISAGRVLFPRKAMVSKNLIHPSYQKLEDVKVGCYYKKKSEVVFGSHDIGRLDLNSDFSGDNTDTVMEDAA